MKRTRRAALAMMAGSSSLLAIETFGRSRVEAERDADVRVVTDSDAYLGLTEDGVEESGLLFEGGVRRPPATFDVVNQLPEPIAVSLRSETFRFDGAEGFEPNRLVVGETGDDRLEPGERIANVSVTPDPAATDPSNGGPVTGAIEIEGRGETTRIDAVRELRLERPDVRVDTADLYVYRSNEPGGRPFEHAWVLRDVDTDGLDLEALRFDYGDIETRDALDFTDGPEPAVTVGGPTATSRGAIERREPTRLDLRLESPFAIGGADLEVVLAGTGGPASPGGGVDTPCGAAVEIDCLVASEAVEAVWRRR